jgi:hypothetical protein
VTPFPVSSNRAITLQSYAGGPAYPGTPQPLGTPWLTEWTLIDGTVDVDLSTIPALVALLTADPPCISCPGLTVTVGGVAYSF